MSKRSINDLENPAIEGLTGYMGVISSDHAYIHQGIGFSFIDDFTLGGNATYKLSFKTPVVEDNKYVHWRPIGVGSTASGIKALLIEMAVPVSSGGLAIEPVCRNRALADVRISSVKVTENVTAVTTSGLLIQAGLVGSGGNNQSRAGGSGDGADLEILLKPDTEYIVELDNLTNTSTDVLLDLFWYEEGGFDPFN